MTEISLTNEGELPTSFKIFTPKIKSSKGEFIFDEEAARSVMEDVADRGVDFSIDFEHDSMSQSIPGHAKIAAGWFKPELRNGELWAANVTWTPRAQAALKNREFRYTSPTFARDSSGRVTKLVNVAITNIPATRGIAPLVLSEDTSMNEFVTLTGADTVDAAKAIVTQWKKNVDEVVALTGKSIDQSIGILHAWRQAFDALPAAEAKVVELSEKIEKSERDAIITSLRNEHGDAAHITPAEEKFIEKLSTDALKAYAEVVQSRVALSRKATSEPNAPNVATVAGVFESLSATELAAKKDLAQLHRLFSANPSLYREVLGLIQQ